MFWWKAQGYPDKITKRKIFRWANDIQCLKCLND